MSPFCALMRLVAAVLIGMLCTADAAKAQAPGPVQPWELPPLPAVVGPLENFAFGGPDNQSIYLEGATSGTFWRFKPPYPGLIGPGGVRLPAQP
jgi:hypothetical protein